MKYVLRSVSDCEDYDPLEPMDWYIRSNEKGSYKIGKAKVFDSRTEAKSFSGLSNWKATYVVIAVTEAELFKARLSNT